MNPRHTYSGDAEVPDSQYRSAARIQQAQLHKLLGAIVARLQNNPRFYTAAQANSIYWSQRHELRKTLFQAGNWFAQRGRIITAAQFESTILKVIQNMEKESHYDPKTCGFTVYFRKCIFRYLQENSTKLTDRLAKVDSALTVVLAGIQRNQRGASADIAPVMAQALDLLNADRKKKQADRKAKLAEMTRIARSQPSLL